MKEKDEKVTRYLKKAILAQVNKGIDFKQDTFYTLSREDLMTGNVEKGITEDIFEEIRKNREKKEKGREGQPQEIDENVSVILVAKTIRTKIEGQEKEQSDAEELTGIFFIPAMLNRKTSSLIRRNG